MAIEQITIVSLADRERWEAEHSCEGLPSQSWSYAHALSASGVEPELAIVRRADARMVMPFFQRRWGAHTDIATTIGLSGVAILPASCAPLELWRDYATARGWVAGYIQLDPRVRLDSAPSSDRLVDVNAVFLLDLRDNRLLESASEIVRRKIRRADRLGARLIENRPRLAESLRSLHPAAMRRVRAQDRYSFSEETLERWALDETSVVVGASVGESIEAVSVFLVAGGNAEYHVNASTDSGRELTAWLIWQAIGQLRSRGVKTLNLGGGARPGDGVYRFKERFHGARAPLRAVCQVYDEATYDELCRRAGARDHGSWFPAYRAPEVAA